MWSIASLTHSCHRFTPSLSQHGSTVSDPDVFTKLTKHWETEFHRDMEALNVRGGRVAMRERTSLAVSLTPHPCRSALPTSSRASPSTCPRSPTLSSASSTTALREFPPPPSSSSPALTLTLPSSPSYESNGSVYFDTVAFQKSDKHTYGKLKPEAVGDVAALAEGEGG